MRGGEKEGERRKSDLKMKMLHSQRYNNIKKMNHNK